MLKIEAQANSHIYFHFAIGGNLNMQFEELTLGTEHSSYRGEAP